MAARKRNTKKEKLDFSKKLAVIITAVFILTWAVAWVVWIINGVLPGELLSYISVPFGVVITGYLAKAGVENYEKIKSNNEKDGTNG